jgi:hypothetical protein
MMTASAWIAPSTALLALSLKMSLKTRILIDAPH